MARWEPDARGRLQQAALDLFAERGFDATGVADIAALAGVTERTFFRHHSDKREVLFAGSEELEELLVGHVSQASPDLPHLEALVQALELSDAFFADRKAFVVARHAVVSASGDLRERELAKLAGLAAALARALRARGAPDVTALLLGDVGVALFRAAFETWVLDPDRSLAALIRKRSEVLTHAIVGTGGPLPMSDAR